MIRIRQRSLLFKNDTYYYEGKLFSGISLAMGAQTKQKSLIIKNGKVVSPYPPMENKWALLPQMDVTEILTEDEYTLVPLGEEYAHFHGLGFEFQLDQCVHELEFSDGRIVGEYWWRLDGKLSSCTLNGKYQQRYEWHKNGTLDKATLSTCQSLYAQLSFLENGSVNFFAVEGDFYSSIAEIIKEIHHLPFRTLDDIALLKSGPVLYLGGHAMNNSFIQNMLHERFFEHTRELTLSDTNASFQTLVALQSLTNLRVVKIASQDSRKDKMVCDLKKLRPDLEVQFELIPTYR